jgi:hypothetical protein
MGLKLLKHTNRDIDLFYTQEMIEDRELCNKQSLDVACWRAEANFIEKNSDYLKIIQENFKKTGLEKKAILTAHGDSIKEHWYFFNEDAGYPVQRWINEMEGKYNLIILDVCNPKKSKINSEKSVVIHPNGGISNRLLMQEKAQLELYLPGIGYLDSYLFEEQLKKLKEK